MIGPLKPVSIDSLAIVIEHLYSDGQAYLQELVAAIENAQQSVDLEVYIIRDDNFGRSVFQALKRATERGVRIRFVVDGFGSAPWLRITGFDIPHDNFELRVFHPLPFMGYYTEGMSSLRALFDNLTKLNRRNHKKLVIVDGNLVILGSHNFWDPSLYWKEIGIKYAPCPDTVMASFEYSWSRSKPYPSWKWLRNKQRWRYKKIPPEQIQLGLTRKIRRLQLKQLCRQIERARRRIWLMTPYFAPPYRLLKSLCDQAKSGTEVCLILPSRSNHFFMKVVSRYYYFKLLKAKVAIYEYEPDMMHAKAIMIDHLAMIGSTNLNHRSFFHDLEIMIYLMYDTSKEALKTEFLQAFQQSRRLHDVKDYRPPLWERILHPLLLAMKNWL